MSTTAHATYRQAMGLPPIEVAIRPMAIQASNRQTMAAHQEPTKFPNSIPVISKIYSTKYRAVNRAERFQATSKFAADQVLNGNGAQTGGVKGGPRLREHLRIGLVVEADDQRFPNP